MRRTPRFQTPRLLAALLVAAVAVSPAFAPDALARAGGGQSMGSRGSRTYSAPPTTNTAPGGGSSFGRTMTPEAPRAPGYNTPGYAQPGFAQGGLSRGSAFTSGLMGGLLGAGIGGLLFGHGLTGGLNGGFSFIGLLLQLAILFFIGRWLFRRFFSGGQPMFAGMGNMARVGQPAPQMASMGGGMAGGAMGGAQPNVAVTQGDYAAFNQSLMAVQDAWSNGDLNALRGLTTPEMASYFAEQLADQASRGVRNTVTAVHLDKGDLAEAWAENGRDYATVAMRFSMLDVTRDMAGRVVDGDPAVRTQATELWTFVRAANGGRWILSGIQQAR